MTKDILLVDGNSIAHANHNGTVLTVGGPSGFQVQAIYGFLRSLRAMLQAADPGTEALVLWDGKAQWRLDIYPEYKGNRAQRDPEQEARHQAFKKQTPIIEKALQLLGVKQARSPLLEADDLANHIVRSIVSRNATRPAAERQRVKLVSGDQDWLQLVREEVSWWDPIRDRTVTTANFLDFTGYFTPAEFVQGKALLGDTSDNIPGIPGIGEKTASAFLAEHRDVHQWLEGCRSGAISPATRKSKKAASLHPEQILASEEGRAIFARNLLLMDMSNCRRPEPGEMVISQAPGNREGFLTLCQRLAFASILREQAMFLKHFNVN